MRKVRFTRVKLFAHCHGGNAESAFEVGSHNFMAYGWVRIIKRTWAEYLGFLIIFVPWTLFVQSGEDYRALLRSLF